MVIGERQGRDDLPAGGSEHVHELPRLRRCRPRRPPARRLAARRSAWAATVAQPVAWRRRPFRRRSAPPRPQRPRRRRRPPPGPRRGAARRAARAAGPSAAHDPRPGRRPASPRCRDRGRAGRCWKPSSSRCTVAPSADSAWRPDAKRLAPTTTSAPGHRARQHQRLVAGRVARSAAPARRRRPPPAPRCDRGGRSRATGSPAARPAPPATGRGRRPAGSCRCRRR